MKAIVLLMLFMLNLRSVHSQDIHKIISNFPEILIDSVVEWKNIPLDEFKIGNDQLDKSKLKFDTDLRIYKSTSNSNFEYRVELDSTTYLEFVKVENGNFEYLLCFSTFKGETNLFKGIFFSSKSDGEFYLVRFYDFQETQALLSEQIDFLMKLIRSSNYKIEGLYRLDSRLKVLNKIQFIDNHVAFLISYFNEANELFELIYFPSIIYSEKRTFKELTYDDLTNIFNADQLKKSEIIYTIKSNLKYRNFIWNYYAYDRTIHQF